MQAAGLRSSRAVGPFRPHVSPFVCPVRVRSTSNGISRAVQAPDAPSSSKPASQLLELHIGDTTLSFPFTPQNAAELRDAFARLLQTFAAKAKAERPKRWEAMDYKLKAATASEGGPDSSSVECFEVFCNPNAYDNHINAKLLVTLKHCGVKLATEAKLHAVKADVDTFLQQHPL